MYSGTLKKLENKIYKFIHYIQFVNCNVISTLDWLAADVECKFEYR